MSLEQAQDGALHGALVDREDLVVLLRVDVEVHGASGKLYQYYIDNVSLSANQKKTLSHAWNVPAGFAPGSYSIQVGIFGTGWNGMHDWNSTAGSLTVKVSVTRARLSSDM